MDTRRRVTYTQTLMTPAERVLAKLERHGLNLCAAIAEAEFQREPTREDTIEFAQNMLRLMIEAAKLERTLMERQHATLH